MKSVTPVKSIVRNIIISNPLGLSCNGNATFIPNIPPIMVGIAINIVTEANTFITILRLFDITEAKKSIVLDKILL